LIASEGAISAYRIVKVGAADYGALQAAAVADKFIGVSTEVDTREPRTCLPIPA
jgi:hypothetical protein